MAECTSLARIGPPESMNHQCFAGEILFWNLLKCKPVEATLPLCAQAKWFHDERLIHVRTTYCGFDNVRGLDG